METQYSAKYDGLMKRRGTGAVRRQLPCPLRHQPPITRFKAYNLAIESQLYFDKRLTIKAINSPNLRYLHQCRLPLAAHAQDERNIWSHANGIRYKDQDYTKAILSPSSQDTPRVSYTMARALKRRCGGKAVPHVERE